jgi:DNA-binding HxlR family transcriptional regulator
VTKNGESNFRKAARGATRAGQDARPTIHNANCPVETTLAVIGGKWKPLILWRLKSGVWRFGELQRLVPGVTRKMLTQHLRELERDGIVARKVYSEVPLKVEYSLTLYGRTLKPLLKELCDWGRRHEKRSAKAIQLMVESG